MTITRHFISGRASVAEIIALCKALTGSTPTRAEIAAIRRILDRRKSRTALPTRH